MQDRAKNIYYVVSFMWNSETGKMRVGIETRPAFALGESMLFGKLRSEGNCLYDGRSQEAGVIKYQGNVCGVEMY